MLESHIFPTLVQFAECAQDSLSSTTIIKGHMWSLH